MSCAQPKHLNCAKVTNMDTKLTDAIEVFLTLSVSELILLKMHS
jgi:hypothetical protein